MNRLKLFAAVAVLWLPLAACEETTPPPPVGSIVGTVSIEGTGIDGVSVNLSNGNSTTTSGGGSYRFDNVEGGAYTVTISGTPSDAMFDATSAAATIASAGQSVTLNFTGAYIRTASVVGTVTVENMGLRGVSVALSGVSSATTVTDDNGQYAFTGLRMGSYSVEISGFDSDEIGFSATSSAVTVGTGESKIVSFDGTYLRTAGITGQVSVEGVGLEGVNVSLAGGPDGEDMSTTTDAAGLYSFAKLRAGDYAVGISGFNTDNYEFAVTSHNVTIALGETANVPFDGILRRTSGVAGRVSVNGMGIADVTVTVSADGMDDVTAMTDATGQYAVSALAAGDYTMTISGYDAVEYSFTDSQDVTLAMDQTMIINFEGTALRTGSIAVSVTADDEGVAGAAVTLTQITGATSGTVLGTQATDADGGATLGPLLAGTYRVDIAVDSDEIDFESTTATMAVATAEAASVSFAGTINRTASISGSVTVDDEGMSGVAVMLTGGEEDMSAETGDDGSYSFSDLRKGDYTVSITNPDEARYEFSSTSESVSLAVGQEQSVNFAGAMTRSSSISGAVTVEGTGLGGVMVMLSGAASDSTETDAAGGYAFTGLGAGTYTVAISGQDADAYVFEMTSMEVMVGDNEAATANFSGTHARTASVSGMLFVDEGTKNDMHDEGEDPFPAPGVPVVLVGPGVGQQLPTATDSTGAFSFSGLVAGTYRLVVPITPEVAAALGDFAYGGPATGYEIELGVGAAHLQGIPFDITHTTVHFGVTLKSGEDRGMPLAGAAVTLYADAAGTDMVGSGVTAMNDAGHAVASIRVARAGTTGNMVHAGVASDDYDVAAGTTPVPWDPQKTYTQGANANDIVNLDVDLTFGGATITSEFGGGDALAGWAVSVAHGDVMEADTLDEDGMAAFKMTLDSAGVLPKTFTFSVDTIQDNRLDGGENFEGTEVEYTHTGLSLAGTVDAGTMQVRYTTQTLKVYVHHERDQVLGYTGNVLDGDERASGALDVSIRYIDGDGRSRSFTSREWNPENASDKDGVYTFAHVPAAANVVVQADEAVARIILLDPDELAAYTAMEENGVTGGAFGARGGFSHTVELCPLKAVNPTGQDHGECGSFAFVETHRVTGLVWKRDVVRTGDTFRVRDPVIVAGVGVALDPVPGKNLAGEQHLQFTAAKNDENTARDDRYQLDMGYIAAGVYGLRVSRGWRIRLGLRGTEERIGDAFSPLDDNVTIDVTPAGGTLYGYVIGSDGFSIDSATVNVNGVSVVTDAVGRYIATGYSPVRGKVFVSASKEGLSAAELDSTSVTFAANRPINHDFTLSGVAKTASISGTVRLSGTNAPVAGASITVDGEAPLNAESRSGHPNFGKLLTDADGNYTAIFPAKGLGSTASASASKAGIAFSPASYPVPAHAGANTSGIAFTGYLHATISGRVVAPGGGPLAGVFISATATGASAAADTLTTGVTGSFSLSVPFGNYDISASASGYSFAYPNNIRRVNVGPGQSVSYGDIQARTFRATNVRAGRQTSTSAGVTTYDGEIVVAWDANAAHVPDGYQEATYSIQYATGNTWMNASATPATDTAGLARFTSPSDGVMLVRVVASSEPTGGGTPILLGSSRATVSAVDPTAGSVVARRSAQGATTDSLVVAWSAVTNSDSEQRLVLRVSVSALDGANVWLETGSITLDSNSRAWSSTISDAAGLSWTVATDDGSPGQSVTVTAADLLKAIEVRVDARQGTSGDYSSGAVATVAAKGS